MHSLTEAGGKSSKKTKFSSSIEKARGRTDANYIHAHASLQHNSVTVSNHGLSYLEFHQTGEMAKL